MIDVSKLELCTGTMSYKEAFPCVWKLDPPRSDVKYAVGCTPDYPANRTFAKNANRTGIMWYYINYYPPHKELWDIAQQLADLANARSRDERR